MQTLRHVHTSETAQYFSSTTQLLPKAEEIAADWNNLDSTLKQTIKIVAPYGMVEDSKGPVYTEIQEDLTRMSLDWDLIKEFNLESANLYTKLFDCSWRLKKEFIHAYMGEFRMCFHLSRNENTQIENQSVPLYIIHKAI